MPQVPEYNRQVRLNGTPQPYQNYRLTEDMFGGGQAKALSNMGGGLNNLANAALKISEQIDDAKMLEMSNQIDQWEQDNLYNKDTGYYYKNGKDAVGKSGEIMKNFDDFVQEYKSKFLDENGLINPIYREDGKLLKNKGFKKLDLNELAKCKL